MYGYNVKIYSGIFVWLLLGCTKVHIFTVFTIKFFDY